MSKILPFKLLAHPKALTPIPVIVDSPHSGGIYPDDFGFSVARDELSIFEDKHIDAIFSGAGAQGFNLLAAQITRSYVDCDQDACQINPRMFYLPQAVNPDKFDANRIKGPFQQTLPNGQSIYTRHLSLSEAQMRLEKYYFPYRLELQRLVLELRQRFPVIAHLSCHTASESSGLDVCFSNDEGETSSNELISVLSDVVRRFGLKAGLLRNARSGSIVRDTGDPLHGVHSAEVYLRRGLYCQGPAQLVSKGFNDCQKLADALVAAAAEFARSCHRSEQAF
jgi:N-formylglutamate deformylase